MPVAGSFIRVTGKENADFAAASAFSLPRIPTWLGIQQKTTSTGRMSAFNRHKRHSVLCKCVSYVSWAQTGTTSSLELWRDGSDNRAPHQVWNCDEMGVTTEHHIKSGTVTRWEWQQSTTSSLELWRDGSDNRASACGNVRELWKTVSHLLVPQTAPPDNFSAQQFSAIFKDKVDAIRSSMVGSSALTSSQSCPTLLHCYSPITTSVIARVLGQSPNKQCSLDPFSTRLVKSLSIIPDIF